MFLVNLRVPGDMITRTFQTFKEAKEFVFSFPSHLVHDFSISPLVEQDPVLTKRDVELPVTINAVIQFSDESKKPIYHVHPKNFYDLILNRFKLSDVYSIKLTFNKHA